MFKRKLSALNYPNADSFDASNQTEFRGLVLWLEFISGVEKLADFLNVPKHPDHLITLQAVSSYVNSRLTAAAIQKPDSVIPEGHPYDLNAQKDLNMDSNDPAVSEAARILRLLYINDLRKLQTQINEAIVSVQTVTANPKTDTRLGKIFKMYKSTLGLGLGSTNKMELNAYLKNLENRSAARSRKHSTSGLKDDYEDKPSEEDSDLLSLAKEFGEEIDSPFIKATEERRKSSIPEPEFLGTFQATKQTNPSHAETALASFMKFDKKYAGGKQVKTAETDSESEPVLSTVDESAQTPVKIVSELEEKTFPRRRRKSSTSSTGKGKPIASPNPAGLSPSPRGVGMRRTSLSPQDQRRPSLKLNIQAAAKKIAEARLSSTPIPTISEVSDIRSRSISPRSPLLDVINLRDISEVLSQLDEEIVAPAGGGDGADNDVHIPDIPLDNPGVKLNSLVEVVEVLTAKQKEQAKEKEKASKNPFTFKADKETLDQPDEKDANSLKQSIEIKSESKSSRQDSNKKKSELLRRETTIKSESINEDTSIHISNNSDDTSEDTLIEETVKPKAETKLKAEKKKKKQRSLDKEDCYYCRNLCNFHREKVQEEGLEESKSQRKSKHKTESEYKKTVTNTDASIQAGKPTLNHYLYNPTLDPMFNLYSGDDDQLFGDSNQLIFGGSQLFNSGVAVAAEKSILNLMQSQLKLTEKHLRIQQSIYRKYCQSLDFNIKKQKPSKEKVLYGRSKPKHGKMTYEEAVKLVKKEMALEQEELEKLSENINRKSSKINSRKSSKSQSTEKSIAESDKTKKSSMKSSNNSLKTDSTIESLVESEVGEYFDDFETET